MFDELFDGFCDALIVRHAFDGEIAGKFDTFTLGFIVGFLAIDSHMIIIIHSV